MSQTVTKPPPCIERKHSEEVHAYSVFEYARAMRRGRGLGPRALAFWEVVWTETAPELQDLTLDWVKTRKGHVRISDWDLYNEQMRQWIGLDPKPENASWIF